MSITTQRFLIIIFSSFGLTLAAQFTESNLPIIVIETGGQELVDEPKIDAQMQIFYDTTGGVNQLSSTEYHFNGHIGIELRGQSSLALFPKKSYGLETRNANGENYNVSLFGWPAENDWVIHSPFSDKSLMRNALSYTIAGGIMPYAPRVKFCELIINGSYEGVVIFTEKIKRDKGRVDISNLKITDISGDQLTGGYIIKFDKGLEEETAWESPFEPVEGAWQKARFLFQYPKKDLITPEQNEYIENYITTFESILKDTNFDDPNIGYHRYINDTSFIDFMIINELAKNVDGYRLSTYMYKDRDSIDGRLHMGPVWDFNLAFGNADYCRGGSTSGWAWDFNDVCPEDYWLIHFWWSRLLESPNFANLFVNRWKYLRTNVISDDSIGSIIDGFKSQLFEPQVRNFQKWPIIGEYIWPNNFIGQTFDQEIEYLKEWSRSRNQWIDSNIDFLMLPTSNSHHLKSEFLDVKIYNNTIYYDIEHTNHSYTVQIVGTNGSIISQNTISGRGSQNLSFPANGIYLINIINDNDSLVKTIVHPSY